VPWLNLLPEDYLKPRNILLGNCGTVRVKCVEHLGRELKNTMLAADVGGVTKGFANRAHVI
jgi:hypothetical protein